MPVTVLDAEIRIAYGTEAEWVAFQALTPTTPLPRGSFCLVASDATFDEETTFRIKIADGSALWDDLPYLLQRAGIGLAANRPTTADDGALYYSTDTDTISIYSVGDTAWENIAGGSGETNTASNVGGGIGLWKQKIGADLEFKTFVAGAGIYISSQTSTLTIAGVKNNVGAGIGDPGATDDSNSGYRITSRWYDTTTDKEFICTSSTVGAATWYEIPASSGSGTGDYFSWDFSTSITLSDPISPNFKFDSATPASIANIYINDTSNSVIASLGFDKLREGDIIYIRQQSDASKHIMLEVSDVPTDNSGWHTIPVSHMHGTSLPANGETCGFDFIATSIERYSTSGPTTDPVGAIGAGSTIDNLTIQEILDLAFYSYQDPSFTSFLLTGGTTSTQEVGSVRTITAATFILDEPGNVVTNSIQVEYPISTVIESGIGIGGSPVDIDPDVVVHRVTEGTESFQIQGSKAAPGTGNFTRNYTMTWRYRAYFGASTIEITTGGGGNDLDDTNGQALIDTDLEITSSPLRTSSDWVVNTGSNNHDDGSYYTYITYPAAWGDLTNVIQGGALPVLGAFTKLGDFTFNNGITNTTYPGGTEISMRVYISNAPGAFADSLDLEFEW